MNLNWKKTVFLIYSVFAAGFLVLAAVPVDYTGLDTSKKWGMYSDGPIGHTEVVPVRSVNVTDVCGQYAAACTRITMTGNGIDAEMRLPERTSMLKQYFYCSHEKQHVNQPMHSHSPDSSLWERTYGYKDSIGWHPKCFEIAAPL